jgi:hypothetical protein
MREGGESKGFFSGAAVDLEKGLVLGVAWALMLLVSLT